MWIVAEGAGMELWPCRQEAWSFHRLKNTLGLGYSSIYGLLDKNYVYR